MTRPRRLRVPRVLRGSELSVSSIMSARDRLFVQLERQLQVARLVARKLDRIDAGVARRAIRFAFSADGAEQPFLREVRDAVGLDVIANLVERMRGRDQLGLSRRVDAVETWGNGRRTTDPQVHFL